MQRILSFRKEGRRGGVKWTRAGRNMGKGIPLERVHNIFALDSNI